MTLEQIYKAAQQCNLTHLPVVSDDTTNDEIKSVNVLYYNCDTEEYYDEQEKEYYLQDFISYHERMEEVKNFEKVLYLT